MPRKGTALSCVTTSADVGALILAALDRAIAEERWEIAQHLMKALESLEVTDNAARYVSLAYLRLIRDIRVDPAA